MLVERRLVLSRVSANLLADKENAFLVSHSRSHSVPSRRRCARPVVSNSHLLGPAAGISRPRTRRHPAPYNNVHMAANSSNSTQELPPSSPYQTLRLPRQLPRSVFCPIKVQAIAAVDPSLVDIPLSYIEHTLQEIGPRLLEATRTATATPPTGPVPQELRLVCNDVSVEPPSHIIAAHAGNDTRMILFPIHAIILATSCARLPTLPISRPATPAAPGGSVTLPVLTLRLPSCATFPTLLSYLYTKRADTLLAELLPVQNTSSVSQLARAHAASFSVNTLIGHVRKVHGLWCNASALGIYDSRLLRSLELAWEVLLDALSISTGQSVDTGITLDGGE